MVETGTNDAFETLRHEPALASFRLTADGETKAAYPFDFVLEVQFAVSGPSWAWRRVENRGPARIVHARPPGADIEFSMTACVT